MSFGPMGLPLEDGNKGLEKVGPSPPKPSVHRPCIGILIFVREFVYRAPHPRSDASVYIKLFVVRDCNGLEILIFNALIISFINVN